MSTLEKEFKNFEKSYDKIYNFLCKNNDNIPNYKALLDEYERRVEKDIVYQSFLSAFASFRDDYLISNRECIAFTIAYNKLTKAEA